MPLDQPSLHKACRPITATVRARVTELIGVIKKAKTDAANAPDLVNTQDVVMKDLSASVPSLAEASQPASSGLRRRSHPNVALDLRAETSQFWGTALPIQALPITDITGSEGFEIAYPLKQKQSAYPIFSEPHHELDQGGRQQALTPSKKVNSTSSPQTTSIAQSQDQDTFTLKALGGAVPQKRKHKASTLENDPPTPTDADNEANTILLPDSDHERKTPKAERKAEKRARRRERRQLEQQERANGATAEPRNKDEDVIPFNYENAPSVLHAHDDGLPDQSRKGKKGKGKGKGKRKDDTDGGKNAGKGAFDPFKKVLDAPSGVKRLQRESQGMSRTFGS
jgi:exosome complex exonuclease RRP6